MAISIDLSGKVILVTGASRGIGRAIAEYILQAGGAVVANYATSKAQADQLVDQFGADRCLAVMADLQEPEAPKRLWNAALSWKGRVDVLVNNTSIRPLTEANAEDEEWDNTWQRVLRVNLIAPAHLCRFATGHFKDCGGGIIINIASRPAFRGDMPESIHDGAAKAGLVSLTRSIARFSGPDNVTAYTITPGIIKTAQAEDFINQYGETEAVKDTPLGELGKPSDIAEIAAFLASGRARYATGCNIDVNGASYIH